MGGADRRHSSPAILIVLVGENTPNDEFSRLFATSQLASSAKYVFLPTPPSLVQYPLPLLRGVARVAKASTTDQLLPVMQQEFRRIITRAVVRPDKPPGDFKNRSQ
jgi:hypothetical protein